ncbi:unnamed protein product [Lactuca saligna]|uniref:Uncharacterized protein n=1 Tax=Lactuca saligna TaxID=75948 RepID=A0AA36E6K6_LACSI|nr:unnamed protein product [Lactuca saligna]
MMKDIATLDHNYSTIHNKVDIIVGAMAKAVELYTSLGVKLDLKAEVDANSFGSVEKLLKELKDLLLKCDFSKSSVVSSESFTKIFCMLESTIQKELAPLAKIVNFMPTNAPSVSTGVQGGERINVGSGSGNKGEARSGGVNGDAKVVGRVLNTQIPTFLPKTLTVTSSTITTTRTISNDIVIGTTGGRLIMKSWIFLNFK